jgi:C-methyltransferase
MVRPLVWAHMSLLRLAWRIAPAHLEVVDTVFGAAKAYMLRTFVRLRIAERLSGEPRSTEALATELGVDGDALHRFLRACAGIGLVQLSPDGRFSLRRAGRVLRRDAPEGVSAFVEYFTSPANLRAWADLDETVRTGRSAFSRATGLPVWSYLEQHPDELSDFCTGIVGGSFADARAIAAAYPFDRFTRVCDVGGGNGTLVGELLGRHPRLHAVLQDSAPVIAQARDALASRGVADRVTFLAESFFARVAPGCDAYLFKNVLHDWDDERALTILRNVRAAASPGARVLVIEAPQERNVAGPPALSDLQMMVICEGGRERSGNEMARLLRGADLGFVRLHPTAGLLAIWEAVVDGRR